MPTENKLSQLFSFGLDILLPQQCHSCKQYSKTLICDNCMTQCVKSIQQHKLNGITNTYSIFNYDDTMKSLLHELKFNKVQPIGSYLSGLLMKHALSVPLPDIDLWIPVPAHANKVRQRGFNPVEVIFKDWATAFGIGYWSPIVLRNRDTESLFELNKEERQSVIHNCFEIVDPQVIVGKRIMLMDDILTTGSTLTEMARILNSASPKSIHAITLAH